MKINENVLVYDVDILGQIEPNGAIKELWEEDALSNAIKIWITSHKGDFIREPNRGGYVIQWFTRPMNTVNRQDIEMAIRNGFDQDFRPYMNIISLHIIPNNEKRYWELYMEVFSNDLNLRATIEERIRYKV